MDDDLLTEPTNDANVKEWTGKAPGACDLCPTPIEDIFIDGKTKYGSWACMCPECHTEVGRGLGTGKGQKYQRQGKRWVKVEG
jgi:hypothetical protein